MNESAARIDALRCISSVKSDLLVLVKRLTNLTEIDDLMIIGSLARNAFITGTSDVDLMLITSDSFSEQSSEQIAATFYQLETPFDVVVVSTDQLGEDVYPSQIMFLRKPDGSIISKPAGSNDFLLSRQDAAEYGISLLGKKTRPRPVPWCLLLQSLRYIFPFLCTHFKNPVLSLCRAMYTFENKRGCSKPVGGEWSLGVVDDRFHAIINRDLRAHKMAQKASFQLEELRTFEQHVREHIGF